MKKIFLILIAVFTLTGCGDDLEFRTPTLQGIKNGDFFWEASGYNVSVISGFTVITAGNGLGTLELVIPSLNVGTYTLSSSSSARASYQENAVFYSTTMDGISSPAHLSDGEIVVESINASNNTMSGTFKFNAYDASGQQTVNFIEGVFYNIPSN